MNSAAAFLKETIGLRSGAEEAVLYELVQNAPFPLPGEYVDLLRTTDGAEGSGTNGYIVLWPAAEVLELNVGYKVSEFTSGLLLIGGNGGNRAFGIDGRDSTTTVYVEVDLIGLSWDDVFFTTSSLVDMLRHFADATV